MKLQKLKVYIVKMHQCWKDGHIIPATTLGRGVELDMQLLSRFHGTDQNLISKWGRTPMIRAMMGRITVATYSLCQQCTSSGCGKTKLKQQPARKNSSTSMTKGYNRKAKQKRQDT